MRDPRRVDDVLEQLRIFWVDHPDLRLCQIVGNFLNDTIRAEPWEEPLMQSRGYNTEDDTLLAYLRARNKGMS